MNSKKELWVLLAAFILPIALGTAFFYYNPSAFTGSTVNYGQFVNPIISTEENDVIFSKDTPGSLKGLWTLAYVSDECGDVCQKILADIKTTRLLMNADMRRIQGLLLTRGDTVKIPQILVARPSLKLSQQLKKFGQFGQLNLFLIDPLGNIMLSYSAQTLNIKRVIRDLKRLFKYSRIG